MAVHLSSPSPSASSPSPSSQALADDLKARGNECIRDGRPHDAIKWYTLAMMHATSLTLLHGNRSTALHHLRQYKLALLDALASTQSDPQWFKGYLLKGKALHSLQRVQSRSD